MNNFATSKEEVVYSYVKVAYYNYQEAYDGAKLLKEAIDDFVIAAETNSSETSKKFENLKIIWKGAARMPYGQSEIFRFYNGPIDFEPINDGVDTYLELKGCEGVEGLLNAWPLDEAYIDYVEGDSNSGLINDRSIQITKEQLVLMNEAQGEKNISTGYHAIEFLLWGQDRDLDSAGDRPYTDFIDGGTASNQDRRRLYLKTLAELLLENLGSVVNEWDVFKDDSYVAEVFKMNPDEVLTNMFTSMISMAGDELKSERIENALLLEDQEEEHSCFSDQTINDIYTNALGIKNVFFGQYQRQSKLAAPIVGKGPSDLLAKVNPSLNNEIRKTFRQLFEQINLFYKKDKGITQVGEILIPFDKAISENKAEIQSIVDSLDTLDGQLRSAAIQLGLKLDL